MKSQTRYLTFETRRRRELVRITGEVEALALASGMQEGMVLVSAKHVTAGRLDRGPWQQVFYHEFDGHRPRRVLLEATGE